MSIIGTLATAAVSILVPGAGITGLILKFGAKEVLGGARKRLKSAGSFIATNWKPLAIIGGIAAVGIYVLILKGEIRHRDKIISAQAVTIGAVKKEVDRGVGKATQAADAPAYIRGFVDNLATVTEALGRQTTALNAAKLDADAHNAAAHQAAQPTEAQGAREKVRQKITDPARTTGLTADEWGKL